MLIGAVNLEERDAKIERYLLPYTAEFQQIRNISANANRS